MRLISILNQLHHFPGFVNVGARLCLGSKSIEVDVRSRKGSKGIGSCCGKPGPTYDHLKVRRFEFVPLWGLAVLLLYRMRRIDCRHCGVKVEQVPWGNGKHQLTTVYLLFLAHWARKLSWKETALSFRTSWEKVFQAVETVVQWGLVHRTLGPISALGVNEVAYGKGHQYMTFVYQSDAHSTRLLWVGKERTVATSSSSSTCSAPTGAERSMSSVPTCGARTCVS